MYKYAIHQNCRPALFHPRFLCISDERELAKDHRVYSLLKDGEAPKEEVYISANDSISGF